MSNSNTKNVIRSIRNFNRQPVTDEETDLLLAGAFDAANARNSQYYSVIVISDQTKKETLQKTISNQPFISSAQKILIFCIDFNRQLEVIKNAGENYDFDKPGLFLTSFVDICLVSQRFIELAWQQGIGTVYIGAIQNNIFSLGDSLGIPENVYPVAMLCIGRFDSMPPKKGRIAAERLIHKERYHPELIEKYVQENIISAEEAKRFVEDSQRPSALKRDEVALQLFKKYIEKDS